MAPPLLHLRDCDWIVASPVRCVEIGRDKRERQESRPRRGCQRSNRILRLREMATSDPSDLTEGCADAGRALRRENIGWRGAVLRQEFGGDVALSARRMIWQRA